MRSDYLVFGQPAIEEAEIEEVVEVLRSAWIGTGPKVHEFERIVAEYVGVSHAVALNSCTAGLHLSFIAAGLGPGDEVITTAWTFCATVNAIVHAGATPVLADIDPETHNIDPEQVRRRLTPRTKAIVPVHFAGRPCDMSALVALAEEHNLTIIEDCAHAIESDYRGKKAGTFGKCGVLSFYANKNVTTGEGGMVLTNDGEVASRIRKLSMHGILQHAWSRFSKGQYKHYEVTDFGFKYNMTDMQAALGIHQMQRVERSWARRKEIWEQYQEAFADLPIGLPAPIADGLRHAFHLYTIQVDPQKCGMHRDDFLTALHHQRIGTGVHYRAIPTHGIYREHFGWRPEDYPVAKKIGDTTVSLPFSPKLSPLDVESVIDAVRRTVTSRRKNPSLVREVLNS